MILLPEEDKKAKTFPVNRHKTRQLKEAADLNSNKKAENSFKNAKQPPVYPGGYLETRNESTE